MGKKGYKAFEKGMICKGKEYKENTTYVGMIYPAVVDVKKGSDDDE